MKIPKTGFTLEDVCRLAHDYGVYIHLGVADANIAETPPTITLQVSSKTNPEPQAFAMQLHRMNPRMNSALSVNLLQYVQKVSPLRLKVVAG